MGDVTRVDSNGSIEPIRLAGSGRGGSLIYGTASPLPSPDGTLIAYLRDQNRSIWLYDTRSKKKYELFRSTLSDPNGGDVLSIRSWSADSKYLLYHDAGEDAGSGTELPYGHLPTAGGQYRFVSIEVSTRGREKIVLPGIFLAWLNDQSFLLVRSQQDVYQDELVRWRLDDVSPKSVLSKRGSYGQVNVDRDGRFILAHWTPRHQESRLVNISIEHGTLTELTTVAHPALRQFPIFSPSGKKFAYLEREMTINGDAISKLRINGKSHSVFVGHPRYSWITDSTVWVLDSCGLTIMNVDGGGVIRRHPLAGRSVKTIEKCNEVNVGW
jgi:Tol biopolymer transport system component